MSRTNPIHESRTSSAPQPIQSLADQDQYDGWVLYDGTCGICGRWVPKWAPSLKKIGLGTSPLQADWVVARTAIPEDQLLEDIHLLTRAGGTIRGADVYRYILRRIWWAIPIYVLSVIPGLSQLFNAAYRAVAKHRYRVSQVCRLDPPRAR